MRANPYSYNKVPEPEEPKWKKWLAIALIVTPLLVLIALLIVAANVPITDILEALVITAFITVPMYLGFRLLKSYHGIK